MKTDEWLKENQRSYWRDECFIIQGLPGAGKTTLYNKIIAHAAERETGISIFHAILDPNKIECEYLAAPGGTSHDVMYVLEGVFTSTDELVARLTAAEKQYSTGHGDWQLRGNVRYLLEIFKSKNRNDYKKMDVTLLYFVPDMEVCKYNDTIRGRGLAHDAIEARFPHMAPINLIEGEVVMLESERANNPEEGKFLDSWWCHGDDDMDEALDKYLAENFPNTTYLQYKRIVKEASKEYDHRFYDYYDEKGTEYRRRVIDISKILEIMGVK
jgi:hypothetical protein